MATSDKIQHTQKRTTNKGFGSRLKEERARLGLNQEEFGRLGGVGKIAQLNYERAARSPSVEYLFALEDSKAGIDVSYLISGVRNAVLHAQAGSVQHRLLTGSVAVIASLGEGCAVKMSAGELSAMAATLYRLAQASGAANMEAGQADDFLARVGGDLFAGWLIGRGFDVPGFGRPQAPSSSVL